MKKKSVSPRGFVSTQFEAWCGAISVSLRIDQGHLGINWLTWPTSVDRPFLSSPDWATGMASHWLWLRHEHAWWLTKFSLLYFNFHLFVFMIMELIMCIIIMIIMCKYYFWTWRYFKSYEFLNHRLLFLNLWWNI